MQALLRVKNPGRLPEMALGFTVSAAGEVFKEECVIFSDLGVEFLSLTEAVDTTSALGKMASSANFEDQRDQSTELATAALSVSSELRDSAPSA
jgi:hypothetical protein